MTTGPINKGQLTPLERAHAARKARAAAGEALVRLDPMEKARRKPTSLRLAVNAKCADCVGWHGDPGARGRIRDCSCTKCPLHPVRPYQKGGEDEDQPLLQNALREGVYIYVSLTDDRIFRSASFASEEIAEAALAKLLREPESLDLADMQQVDDA
jgi:hypothetical protein